MQAARGIVQRALLTVVQLPQSAESAVLEHRGVCEAIASANPDWARNAMRDHLERVERDAQRALARG
jgi:DNA-binding FadR family transcriptional regulator